MKVCFVGACGHWKQAYEELKSLPDVTVCGFAPGHPRETQVSPMEPSVPFFGDYRSMLDTVRPDLAVVSPVFGVTGQVILECAARKIHVFSEKPVAASLEELAAVRRAVTESGIRFCAMHYLRYQPSFYRAARIVKDGGIGKPVMITAQKSYKYGTRPEWYGDRSLYGGTIPWVGIHGVDWISAFTGRRFLSVNAQSVGKDPEMAALCQFRMEDDLIAAVNIDFYRPAGAPTHGDDRVRCVGTEGILEVIGGKITLIDRNGMTEMEPKEAPLLLTEFLKGNEPISPEEIFHITQAAIAARDSADTGREVRIGG